jgi:hypothetical protein
MNFLKIKNRGVKDACIVASDGLTGLSESITATLPEAIHQTCVLHLIRNTFRHASKSDWPAIAGDLRPACQAATEAAARQRFEDFDEKWGRRYPQRSPASGNRRGRSSRRSPSSIPSSGPWSTPRTRSRVSTPGSAGPCVLGATSRPSPLPSSASTSACAAWTPPVRDDNAG